MSDINWRPSSREEIHDYYQSKFPQCIGQLPDWITPNGPMEYALAFREEYPARRKGEDIPPKDFIRRQTRNKHDPEQIFIEGWDTVLDFIQQPATHDPFGKATDRYSGLVHPDIVQKDDSYPDINPPVAEAVYYALDNFDEFWVLAFDIDAKDVAKSRIAPGNKSYQEVPGKALKQAGVVDNPPKPATVNGYTAEYKYEFQDVRGALEYAFKLEEFLSDNIGFSDTRVYYSGQGAHVYARDSDPYYKYTFQSRKFLTAYIQENLGIPIDDAVTWDQSRVMRMPCSLHADVNRVVTEVTSPDFNFQQHAFPGQRLNKAVDGGRKQ